METRNRKGLDFSEPYRLQEGFPGGTSGKEPTCQCRRLKRYRFDFWVGKIPWRRSWQPSPVFLPRESPWTKEPGGLQSMGLKSRTRMKWLGMHTGTRAIRTLAFFWAFYLSEAIEGLELIMRCDLGFNSRFWLLYWEFTVCGCGRMQSH